MNIPLVHFRSSAAGRPPSPRFYLKSEKGDRLRFSLLLKFLSLFFLLSPLIFSSELFAQPEEPQKGIVGSLLVRDSVEQRAISEDLDIISIGLEIIPSSGSGSFFGEYRKLFGTARALDPVVSPTLIGRIRISDKFRLVFGSSYMGTGFSDIYDAYNFPSSIPDADSLIPAAQIVERMSVDAIPVVVGFQYTPIRSQFTSYVGAAAGGAFVTANWQTLTRRFENSIYFRPETNVDGPTFAPALRLFTGLDLRFDGFFANKNLFRGVYIEAAYFYLPVSLDYFKEVRTIGRGIPVLPSEDDATLNLGGVTITLGVNMQLLRL